MQPIEDDSRPHMQMNVMAHSLVGAYLCRLAIGEAVSRPQSVAEFMGALADFVNDELGIDAMQASYDGATRKWRIPGVLELTGFDETADINFHQHAPNVVNLRLPEREAISESRNVAVAFDAGRRKSALYVQPFYYDYIRGGDAAPSNLEFLESRVADYVFARCR